MTRFTLRVAISGVGGGGWRVAQNPGQSIVTQPLSGGEIGAAWSVHGPSIAWNALASSADGMKLFASTSSSYLYTSTDAGVTWTARDSNRSWEGVASSADGARLAAVQYYDGSAHPMLTSTPTPRDSTTVGPTGALSSGQYGSITLQYAGGGKFVVKSHIGTFSVQ